MRRSKKIQTRRIRKVRKTRQGRRSTRHRGGRVKPRNYAREEANRRASTEAITENTRGFIPQEQNVAINNDNNSYNNNNNTNNNNNNYTNNNNNNNNSYMNNDPDILKNEELLEKVYLALNTSFDDEAERKKVRKALDKYFYAIFYTGPKKSPGNSIDSLADSFIYEAQKYLGYTFTKDSLPFMFVIEDLFKAYQHFKALDSDAKKSNFIKQQEELNDESINL